jgi:hypothetical protein
MTQASLNTTPPFYWSKFPIPAACAYGYVLPGGTPGAGCQTQINGGATSPVYAEPLWVPSVSGTGCGTSANLLIVATADNYVLAYDADNITCSSGTNLAWSTSLIYDLGDCGGVGPGGNTIVKPAYLNTKVGSSMPYAGIMSTPVIDTATNIIYVVGACSDGTYDHWIFHALNLLTGLDKVSGTKVDITKASGGNPVFVPSLPGTLGATQPNGQYVLELNPKYQSQRGALTLVPSVATGTNEVYFPLAVTNIAETPPYVGSSWDNPYHGWLVGYAVNTSDGTIQTANCPNCANFAFSSTAVNDTNGFTCTTPGSGNGSYGVNPSSACPSDSVCNPYPADGNDCGLGGGIWQSGRGAVTYQVGGNTYIAVGTGNGGFQVDSTSGKTVNFGSSVVGFNAATTCNTANATTVACAPYQSFTPNCYGNVSYAACTPGNPQYFTMNLFDQDMNSGLLATQIQSPSGNAVLVGFDKSATGYALDDANLGGFAAGTNGADLVVGEFPGSTTSPLCYTPSGYSSSTSCTPPTSPYTDSNNNTVNRKCNGSSNPNTSTYSDPYQFGQCNMITSQVYWHDNSSEADYLFVFPTNEDVDWCYWNSGIGNNGNFVCTPDSTHIATDHLSPVGSPGGSLVLSLNANATSPLDSAVLWVLAFNQSAPNQPYVDPGTCRSSGCFTGYLRAYGTTTGEEPPGGGHSGSYPDFSIDYIWENTSDTAWTGSPLSQITLINGRLYVPTYDSGVRVYDNWEPSLR